ncbi:peptidoglycan D,D-transpeptidase FtsI family protein [Rhodococcus erythropolis]|jgi:peptidoglycan glycosyltransferase|uniref:Penicillin-binding protein 2 n=2 Tax=Rhodococcus erythropolis group TaxID=2840174 RepID=A0A2A5JI64_RHOSG|nr:MULTISPECIES: penicillin-binding protein 2 [Rhodococcus]EEN86824.1 penicillin-binding protein, transpeptidase domain protein [Rhodococcus erythropolis SK121]AKD95396.1 penicillin-binding protein [Rhodococcus erythropolis]MBJ7478568.1 penicillin-binding protein 2 [Rhodococcus sp. (in: high G+C Gram-positive bacteria)]MDF3318730.1 penicillin-binding protein 2 [Rhodococcus sp. C3V]PCK29278.1 penicillin-binding protein 2 [Rhodococcus qingshengii]
MNTPLRRVAMAVMVMVVALLANATYVQVIKADDLRADPRNSRVLLDEYSRQRGQISASGQVLAASRATDDRYKYLREYPNPYPYAPVTGFYSMQYGSAGLERTEDPILNGSDNRLFSQRFFDLVSGRDPRGGNVVTTLNPAMQQVAYDQLTSKGYTGSVVAIEPSTGRILTMVSTPSYDPNLLASHDGAETTKAWDELNADPNDPLVNRAISQTYPPGSTFKVLTTAAALGNGATPDDQLTAAPQITLPGTNTTLENYNGSTCGPNPTASLRDAFARSCNTAFVELGIKDGADAIKDEASAFGIGPNTPAIPLPVADSTVGDISDDAALGQTSIGQRDVAVTPLENAVIAATVANGGVRMQPNLISQLQAPDLTDLSTPSPVSMGQAISPAVAATLTDLMIGSENFTGGDGKIPGVQIASKTGTAEHGVNPRETPPHAWYIAFAPAQNPTVAVAVIVENGGDRGLAATGGSVAAPIGRAVIAAGIQGG